MEKEALSAADAAISMPGECSSSLGAVRHRVPCRSGRCAETGKGSMEKEARNDESLDRR